MASLMKSLNSQTTETQKESYSSIYDTVEKDSNSYEKLSQKLLQKKVCDVCWEYDCICVCCESEGCGGECSCVKCHGCATHRGEEKAKSIACHFIDDRLIMVKGVPEKDASIAGREMMKELKKWFKMEYPSDENHFTLNRIKSEIYSKLKLVYNAGQHDGKWYGIEFKKEEETDLTKKEEEVYICKKCGEIKDDLFDDCVCVRCYTCGVIAEDCECYKCDNCGELNTFCRCDRCDMCGVIVCECEEDVTIEEEKKKCEIYTCTFCEKKVCVCEEVMPKMNNGKQGTREKKRAEEERISRKCTDMSLKIKQLENKVSQLEIKNIQLVEENIRFDAEMKVFRTLYKEEKEEVIRLRIS